MRPSRITGGVGAAHSPLGARNRAGAPFGLRGSTTKRPYNWRFWGLWHSSAGTWRCRPPTRPMAMGGSASGQVGPRGRPELMRRWTRGPWRESPEAGGSSSALIEKPLRQCLLAGRGPSERRWAKDFDAAILHCRRAVGPRVPPSGLGHPQRHRHRSSRLADRRRRAFAHTSSRTHALVSSVTPQRSTLIQPTHDHREPAKAAGP
jgi:hypothetical protein